MSRVSATADRPHRLTPVLREESRVTPLELFFDLVFVLALTQCTALMADDPTWEGIARGMLVLGVMRKWPRRTSSGCSSANASG